jgi:hypothetical protein
MYQKRIFDKSASLVYDESTSFCGREPMLEDYKVPISKLKEDILDVWGRL